MNVQIVTKVGCPRCLLLKQKLGHLKVSYTEMTSGPVPDDKQLPLVKIDGEFYEYAAAMKKLKEMTRGTDA